MTTEKNRENSNVNNQSKMSADEFKLIMDKWKPLRADRDEWKQKFIKDSNGQQISGAVIDELIELPYKRIEAINKIIDSLGRTNMNKDKFTSFQAYTENVQDKANSWGKHIITSKDG